MNNVENSVANLKSQKLLNGVAYWGTFYRFNPQRFCKDYLNITLRLFQKILIYAMMVNDHFMFFASRGLGKTWLTALFCVVRCILYPSTKICVTSGTKKQAMEVLDKITDDFCKNYGWGSENLKREICEVRNNSMEQKIIFRNGSWIKVVTPSDNARGSRANILIVDEFRMVKESVIKVVLKKFLTSPRQPNYLNDKQYKHLQEPNKEIYMSSAWYKSHWSFAKAKAYTTKLIESGRNYFICGLPYQIAIKENLLMKQAVEDEMSESDFDETTFSIEMECLFYGNSESSFFQFEEIDSCRVLKDGFSENGKIPDLLLNERRILSLDVALMSGKNNDNSSIIVNRAIPSKSNRYISNLVYLENIEGATAEELALKVRRLYEEFKCTDIVVDINGSGLTVYDCLAKDIYDSEKGLSYSALSCINEKTLADRCKVHNAPKVIWGIKATQQFNSDACISLRNAFKGKRINLLLSEQNIEEYMSETNKLYKNMSLYEKIQCKHNYIQTTLLIYELINLSYEVTGTSIRLFETRSRRKDRYSSLLYNYWVQNQLEQNLAQMINDNFNLESYAEKLRKLNKRPTIH